MHNDHPVGRIWNMQKGTSRKLSKLDEHCWRSRDKLISDVLLWTSSHGRVKAGRSDWTYIHQLCVDTGCSPEDLPEVMNDKERWRERARSIYDDGTTRWWWQKGKTQKKKKKGCPGYDTNFHLSKKKKKKKKKTRFKNYKHWIIIWETI